MKMAGAVFSRSGSIDSFGTPPPGTEMLSTPPATMQSEPSERSELPAIAMVCRPAGTSGERYLVRSFRPGPLQLPQGETAAASAGRRHHNALVLRPAHAPRKRDVPDLARLRLERPFHDAALVAQIG